MPRATLIIDADTSAIRRAMGELPGITSRAQTAMTGTSRRGGRERTGIDQTFAREHESIHARLVRAREKRAREETDKVKAEERKKVQADAGFARERDSIHARLSSARERRERDETQKVAAEGRRRVRADANFSREHDRIHTAMVRARVARERTAQREIDTLTRERRTLGRSVGGHVAPLVGTIATDEHGRIQAARQTAAERTSTINTSLVQRGTSQSENAEDNAAIQARLAQVRTGVAPEVGIAAIANAQSFANTLGGDTRAQRVANRDATLADVEFAGAIDPTNVGGIVNMGAILRRKVQDPAMRQRILRGAVGTAFEGSVETDAMIGSALPGLLQAISAATAHSTNDVDRDRITAEVSQDFFSQMQAQAAGGRTVGVSANRTNTVRTALSNAPRQNRLGLALAERARSGTPEQQAAFSAAFTKDAQGQYSMNAEMRDTPSNAARFLGTMFDNDDGALRNFMGAHGGGGAHQLMNVPDVAAIGSYFGMTTGRDGRAIREYDHVEELKGATVTDAQAETMRATRAGEDRTRLLREQEDAMARSRAPGTTTRASDAATSFATAHPILAMLGMTSSTAALGAGAKSAGSAAVGLVGAGPAAIMALLAGAGLGLGAYGSNREAASGVGADGQRLSTGERVGKGVAATAAPFLFAPAGLLTSLNDLTAVIRELNANPMTATIAPADAAHVASGAIPGRRRPGEG